VALFLSLSVSIFVTIQDDREKKQEIVLLTCKLEKITNQFTGGDSYPYVQFGFLHGENNAVIAWLFNLGDYPLYDVQVQMVDLHIHNNVMQSLGLQEAVSEEQLRKSEMIFPSVTIGPHGGVEICRIKIPVGLDAYGYTRV
jgi:hypothetical protein